MKEMREPVGHYTSLETEVWIPAAQAGLVALAWSLVVALVLAFLAAWQGWPWWTVPLAAVAFALALFAVRLTAYIAEHRERLWRHEVATGRDLDADGYVGPPPSEPDEPGPALVFVRDPGRERRRQASADFRYFLREAYNGRGTTWRRWDGERLPSGRRMTRPLWEEYTERLIRAGLATRPYPTAELELLGDYRAALEAFAEAL